MAIWLVAWACGAKLPRRLVYVVDRRAVVDQATDEASKLRSFVDAEPSLKQKLGLANDRSLPISTLRGQYVDNREWLEDPAAPAIIVGTVDMIGSRLLFEGYGVSRKMRPYHAGLIGADALVVLDEAHLVPPFEHLLRAVATDSAFGPREKHEEQLVPRFQILALSATGRARTHDLVALTEADFKHEVVKKRLNAKKLLVIKPLDGETKLEDALAEEAWKLTGNGKKAARVIVYSDRREVAQKAKDAVEKLAKGDKKAGVSAVEIDTELFVGGRRVFEREQAKKRLVNLGFIAGSRVERNTPVFLFATSAGEVGVDLDADHMVCDLVAWERMVQRLGRVNRRGDGEARVVVIVRSDPDGETRKALHKENQGKELTVKERSIVEKFQRAKAVKELIEQLPKIHDGSYDASPGALRDLKTRVVTDEAVRKILDDATTPEPLRPALTRPLVDAWAMTSLEKHTGRPEIQPWLRGWIEDEAPQTRVVWRKYLPIRSGGPAPRDKEIELFFEAAPLHMSEILETETSRVVEWLAKRAESALKPPAEQDDAAVSGTRCRDDDVVAFALDPDGRLRRRFMLRELLSFHDKKGFEKLLAGTTLVLDARLGGLKEGLLDPKEGGLPPTADGGEAWLGEGAVGFRVRSIEAPTVLTKDSNWRERYRFASEVTEDGEPIRWLFVEKWRTDAATEEDRSAANPQLLDEHECWTEDRARRLAKALGLNGDYEDCHRSPYRSHFVIGIKEPGRDRHIGASAGSA
jgi:CRISPR-associated endonuclease/helicase Cas3